MRARRLCVPAASALRAAGAFATALLLALSPCAAGAQRFEMSVVGAAVSPAAYDYERVTVVSFDGSRARKRADRSHGTALGANASIALSFNDRWRLEGGLLVQPVDRRTQSTAAPDVDGPFVSSTTEQGTLLNGWLGILYRPWQSSRGNVSLVAGPAVVNFIGDAYDDDVDEFGSASVPVSVGLLLAARGTYFVYRDYAVQLSLEYAGHRFPLVERNADFTPNPGTSERTPWQNDVRVSAGLTRRFF